MKKVFCIIGMILFSIPAVLGVALAMPFALIQEAYNEVKR